MPLNKRRTHYDLDRHFELFLEANSLDAVTTKKTFLHPKEIKHRPFSQSMHPIKLRTEAPPITIVSSNNVFWPFFSESRNTQHVLDNERTVWKYTCDRRLFAVHAPQLEVSPAPHPVPDRAVRITKTLQTLRRAWSGLTWLRTVCGRQQFRVSSRHNSGTSDITGPSYSCVTSRRDTPVVLPCGHL